MKDMAKTVADVIVQFIAWFFINLVLKGSFAPPTINQLTFSLAVLALIRSNREGGAA